MYDKHRVSSLRRRADTEFQVSPHSPVREHTCPHSAPSHPPFLPDSTLINRRHLFCLERYDSCHPIFLYLEVVSSASLTSVLHMTPVLCNVLLYLVIRTLHSLCHVILLTKSSHLSLFSACDLIIPYQSFLSFLVPFIMYLSSFSFPIIASLTHHIINVITFCPHYNPRII